MAVLQSGQQHSFKHPDMGRVGSLPNNFYWQFNELICQPIMKIGLSLVTDFILSHANCPCKV